MEFDGPVTSRPGVQPATRSARFRIDRRGSLLGLNAVCPDTPLPGGVSPGPCTVTLAFRDANGTVLSRAVKTLDAGQGAWIDWNGAQNVRGRTEIQPSVPAISAGFALITVEVFDNMTGRTLASMGPAEPKSLSFVGR